MPRLQAAQKPGEGPPEASAPAAPTTGPSASENQPGKPQPPLQAAVAQKGTQGDVFASQHTHRGTDRDGIERKAPKRAPPSAAAAAASAAPGGAGSVEDDGTKIRVVVRKRPLTRKEGSGAELDVIQTVTRRTLLVHEPKLKVDLTKFCETHRFTVDDAFDQTVDTASLYKVACAPLVSSVFSGTACTCFAYGQTGSGKTYTMMGDAKSLRGEAGGSPGVYMLAAQDIFATIEARNLQDVEVLVSYYEIYGSKLHDLLGGRAELRALEDAGGVVNIVGLSEQPVANVAECMRTIAEGNANRSVGSTAANLDSSRSHAVLQLVLRRLPGPGAIVDESGEEVGRFSFIDLAGSERGADTGASSKKTRMEGAEINKSLLALKECIRSLYLEHSHLPFRGSKLTQVLKDSFMGNSRTVMIATISPNVSNCEHTLNTLRYAYRVKEIQCEDPAHADRYQPPHGHAHELDGAFTPAQLAALVAGRKPRRTGRRRAPAPTPAPSAAPASAPPPAPAPAPTPAPSNLPSARPATSSDGSRRRSMAGATEARPTTGSSHRRSSMGSGASDAASRRSKAGGKPKPKSGRRSSLPGGKSSSARASSGSSRGSRSARDRQAKAPRPSQDAAPSASASAAATSAGGQGSGGPVLPPQALEALPPAVADTVRRHMEQAKAMGALLEQEQRLAAAMVSACSDASQGASCEGHLRAYADGVEDLLAEKLALIDALAQDIVNLKRRRGWLTPTPGGDGGDDGPGGMWAGEGKQSMSSTPQVEGGFTSPVRPSMSPA